MKQPKGVSGKFAFAALLVPHCFLSCGLCECICCEAVLHSHLLVGYYLRLFLPLYYIPCPTLVPALPFLCHLMMTSPLACYVRSCSKAIAPISECSRAGPANADTVLDMPSAAQMQSFLRSLPSASVDDEQSIFSFTEPALGEPKNPTRLFIRQAYKELWQIMEMATGDGLPDLVFDIENGTYSGDVATARRRTFEAFNITGTPGIGKSMFAIYVMALLCKKPVGERPTIVFHHHKYKSVFFVLSPDNSVVIKNATGISELANPTTWYIVDGEKPELGYSAACRVLLVTSPRRDIYKELKKEHRTLSRYMPLFSLEEIEECGRKCFEWADADVDRAISRFELFGGIARFLFGPAESAVPGEIDGAISNIDLKKMETVIGEAASGREESHLIMHYVVRLVSRTGRELPIEQRYHFADIQFGSLYIAKRVFEKLETIQHSDLIKFLKSAEPGAGGVRGQLFEQFAHTAIARGGTFRVKSLTAEGAWEDRNFGVERKRVWFPKLADITGPDYFIPLSKRFCALDAVTLDPPQAFQMTVSPAHPVLYTGLRDFLDCVRKAKGIPDPSIPLYFAVPLAVIEAEGFHGPQPVKGTTQHPATITAVASRFPQYLLEVPLV